jgi:hypothetical protein
MVDLNNFYKNNTSDTSRSLLPPSLAPSLPPSRLMIHMNHILYITLSPLSPVSRCVCMHTHTTCSLYLSLSFPIARGAGCGGLPKILKSQHPRKYALIKHYIPTLDF